MVNPRDLAGERRRRRRRRRRNEKHAKKSESVYLKKKKKKNSKQNEADTRYKPKLVTLCLYGGEVGERIRVEQCTKKAYIM